MTEMALITHQASSGPVLSVIGEFDHESADQFRTAVHAIELEPGQLLTVDLSALAFCDSSGINAILAAHNHTRALGADLALAYVPPTTARILRLLGLDHVLRILPTPETGNGLV